MPFHLQQKQYSQVLICAGYHEEEECVIPSCPADEWLTHKEFPLLGSVSGSLPQSLTQHIGRCVYREVQALTKQSFNQLFRERPTPPFFTWHPEKKRKHIGTGKSTAARCRRLAAFPTVEVNKVSGTQRLQSNSPEAVNIGSMKDCRWRREETPSLQGVLLEACVDCWATWLWRGHYRRLKIPETSFSKGGRGILFNKMKLFMVHVTFEVATGQLQAEQHSDMMKSEFGMALLEATVSFRAFSNK